MAKFLTEYRTLDGKVWAGPEIEAKSWHEAKAQFHTVKESLRLIGVLAEEIDAETGARTMFPEPEEDNEKSE